MIKIDKTEVFGWEAAIRGMRNPMNSWDKSDSCWEITNTDYGSIYEPVKFVIGENDLKLMKNLAKAGSDHGKFLRMINVTFDCLAPLYWWKEADTYAVGKVQNSCSTMHKAHAKDFTLDDFSCEHLINGTSKLILSSVIELINQYRRQFVATNNKEYWWQIIQLLPSSYNQKRTVQLNYQVLKNMYHARKNHKLDEWHDFCDWCEGLPYFKELCIGSE